MNKLTITSAALLLVSSFAMGCATTAQLPKTELTSIPAVYHGQWEQGPCGSDKFGVYTLRITDREMRWYENSSSVKSVVAKDGGVLVTASSEGEGSIWATMVHLRVNGDQLTVTSFPEEFSYTRTKCGPYSFDD